MAASPRPDAQCVPESSEPPQGKTAEILTFWQEHVGPVKEITTPDRDGRGFELHVRPPRERIIPISHRIPAARSREHRGSRPTRTRGSRRGRPQARAPGGDDPGGGDPEPELAGPSS